MKNIYALTRNSNTSPKITICTLMELEEWNNGGLFNERDDERYPVDVLLTEGETGDFSCEKVTLAEAKEYIHEGRMVCGSHVNADVSCGAGFARKGLYKYI